MSVCLLPPAALAADCPAPSSMSLSSKVLDRLQKSSYRPMRRISVAWRDGVLTLGGQVPSYYLKQVAQSIAFQVEGVQRVDNHIEVRSYCSG